MLRIENGVELQGEVLKTQLRVLGAVGASLLLSVSLVGCANPIEQIAKKGLESAVQGATGSDVDVNLGSGASLPENWPDIPTPSGEIQLALNAGGGFNVTFLVDPAEAERVMSEFASSGYTSTGTYDAGEGKMHMYEGPEWSVAIITATNAEAGKTAMVYTVSPLQQ